MAGDGILANIVTDILNKLNPFVLEDINPALGVKKELEKLQKTILMIEAVIRDADNKQVKEEAARIWLKELKDLAYDADDILDEYAYDIMRGLNRMGDKVCNFISLSSNPIVLSSKMGHKIKKLNQKFDEIARRRVWLSSQIIHLGSLSSHTKDDDRNRIYQDTCSLVDDSEIVGREVDKSKIINMLFAENLCNQFEKIPVIPIVGMGGLGKTTLAQIVYNDDVVKDHFESRMWVYVSSEFNAQRLFSKILESFTHTKCEDLDMNVIVHQLQQRLMGKTYLLVLDDVWNMSADQWNRLRFPLSCGANRSRIIITTRSEEVASIVGIHKNLPIYKLEALGEDDCWSIFKQNAFVSTEQTPTLVAIGKELVKKCGGLPLAVKALGSLMQFKKEEREWLTFRNNEIWDAPSEVLQVLKLSYDHLPSHLKRCFSYCSIFPKDSEIKRETLIQLWIAEGFIQPPKGAMISMEEIGNEYFSSLLLNSFFQEVKRDYKLGDITVYKMPNLLHDLAQFVTGTHECSIVEASQVRDISELRRLRLLNFDEESSAIVEKALKNARKLRTIFANQGTIKDIEHVFNNKQLRVLDLSRTEIKELPSSIGRLKHLRYLDLSFTGITKLPDSITRLYHLQTLNLTGCWNLNKLPKDLNKLMNLRHLLYNHDYRHKFESPIEIPQLANLPTLEKSKVPSNMIEGIAESEDLTYGGGQVENLERVKDRKKADKENLKQTQNIKRVALTWNDETMLDEDHDSNTDSLVLEGLRPHPSLRSLVITCFMVPTFPKWMGDPLCLPNLVELELHSCNRCEQLPALGKLPFLRLLIVRGMIAIKRLGREFYYEGGEGSILLSEAAATNTTIAFPSLNELVLDDMPNLEEWVESLQPKVPFSTYASSSTSTFNLEEWVESLLPKVPFSTSASSSTSTSSFPLLESIKIKLCPKLKSIPTLFPSLSNLEFYSSNGTSLSSVVKSNLGSLVSLYIEEVPRLVFLPQGLLTNNNVLQSLDIYDCPDFQGFIHQGGERELFNSSNSSSLQSLTILDCPVLTFLPGIRGMTSLRRLTILDCNKELNIVPNYLEWQECLPSLEEFDFGFSHPNEIEEAEE